MALIPFYEQHFFLIVLLFFSIPLIIGYSIVTYFRFRQGAQILLFSLMSVFVVALFSDPEARFLLFYLLLFLSLILGSGAVFHRLKKYKK